MLPCPFFEITRHYWKYSIIYYWDVISLGSDMFPSGGIESPLSSILSKKLPLVISLFFKIKNIY